MLILISTKLQKKLSPPKTWEEVNERLIKMANNRNNDVYVDQVEYFGTEEDNYLIVSNNGEDRIPRSDFEISIFDSNSEAAEHFRKTAKPLDLSTLALDKALKEN
jgi:hypothetical protein